MARPFPTRPRELAQYQQELRLLADSIGDSPFVQDSVLDPVIPFLDQRRIPDGQTRTYANRVAVELAIACAGVLWTCAGHIETNERLCAKIIGLWPGTWSWFEYLLAHCVETPSYGEDVRFTCAPYVVQALLALSESPALRATMANTDGFLATVTHHWIEGCLDYLPPIRENRGISGVLSAFLGAADLSIDMTPLFYAAGGRKALARMALLHFNSHLNQDSFDGDDVAKHLTIVLRLAMWNDFELLDIFLRLGLTCALVRGLAVCGAQRVIDDDVRSSAMFCMNLLTTVFDRKLDAVRWVVQAVDAGLLRSLLAVERLLADSKDDDSVVWLILVQNYLAPHLIYRPVIRAVERRLVELDRSWPFCPRKSIPVEGIEKSNLHHLTPQDAWKSFLALVDDRMSLKCDFDAVHKQICGSCLKGYLEDRPVLKQCSVCRGSRYCSRECQRRDWPQHRKMCKNFIDDENQEWASLNEQTFLLFIAARDFKFHIEEFNKIIATDYPSLPADQLVFGLDYEIWPVRLFVDSSVERISPGPRRVWLLARAQHGMSDKAICAPIEAPEALQVRL